MGIAANAVADLVGAPPPSPRPSAYASDENDNAPSFQERVQDHIQEQRDADDRPAPRDERPGPKSDAREQTRAQRAAQRAAQAAAQSASSQASDQSEETAPGEPAHAEDEHSETKSDTVAAPLFLQLIANAIASTIGAKAPQASAQQVTSTAAEQAAAQANSASATTLVSAAAPIKIMPKADVGAARPAQGKTAKEAEAKSEATPTTSAEGGAPTAQAQNAAPITLAMAGAANHDAQGAQNAEAAQDAQNGLDIVKSSGSAKSETAEDVQAAAARAAQAQDQPRQAPRTTASPIAALETLAQANAPEAKPRDAGKALPQIEALKQAAQDFAPATPKVQATSSALPPASAHPQLAAPLEQVAASTDARTQAAPVAAQVGGEIIRRFNGQDTSFQLRLDPPDLGRVDVRLDVSRDHRVTAVISADNPQALSDLARGARDLQQALQSAGLDLADDGLRFDLSSNGQGNSFAQAQAQHDQSNVRTANAAHAQTPTAPEITPSRPLSIDRWRGARVDVMA